MRIIISRVAENTEFNGSCDVKSVTSIYDTDVAHQHFEAVKAWNKQKNCYFWWKKEIYFISWTWVGDIFTIGKSLAKICRLLPPGWNEFRSSTENNSYPIHNPAGQCACKEFFCKYAVKLVYLATERSWLFDVSPP